MITLFFVVGCHEKNMDCELTIIEKSDLKIIKKVELNYKNDKIKNEKVTISYITDKNVDTMKSSLESQYEKYLNYEGIVYYFNDTEVGFDFIIDANLKKLDKLIISELELIDYKYDKAYQNFRNNGYVCK